MFIGFLHGTLRGTREKNLLSWVPVQVAEFQNSCTLCCWVPVKFVNQHLKNWTLALQRNSTTSEGNFSSFWSYDNLTGLWLTFDWTFFEILHTVFFWRYCFWRHFENFFLYDWNFFSLLSVLNLDSFISWCCLNFFDVLNENRFHVCVTFGDLILIWEFF